jgi:type I restriction enzyme M protein
MTSTSSKISKKSNEVWSVADTLRGPFKEHQYQQIMLPFIVIRRLETVIEGSGTKENVLQAIIDLDGDLTGSNLHEYLKTISGLEFYCTSNYSFSKLLTEPDNLKDNLLKYVNSYSDSVISILDSLKFKDTVEQLDSLGLLFRVAQDFSAMDLSVLSETNPDGLSNHEMGYLFEELLSKFSDMSNADAGDHYTPRSVVRLCAELAIGSDLNLNDNSAVKSIYDPTAGTGGMLTVGEEVIKEKYPDVKVELFGQEFNPESYAISKADLLIKGYDSEGIKFGDTLSNDRFPNNKFDYILANPPYGVDWKASSNHVLNEIKNLGFRGRFGAGKPSIKDGSLLFLQHMISKMKPEGSRVAIVLNSSPMTNGDAESGESNIRKWILENDLLETIIALPTEMFYNTTIGTYIWVLNNKKTDNRKNKILLINARSFFYKLKKAIGEKKNDLNGENIQNILELNNLFSNTDHSVVLNNSDFLFSKIRIDQPEVDASGKFLYNKGQIKIDSKQKSFEKVFGDVIISDYIKEKIAPLYPGAIIEESKISFGAVIPFDSYFKKFETLPTVEELSLELKKSISNMQILLSDLLRGTDE